MLTRVIVNLYAWIMEIFLWFVLLIAGVAGYHYTVPLLKNAGAIPESEAVWKIYGALGFAVAALVLSAVVIGPILVLVDIRKSVRAFETKKSNGDSSGVLPAERREPLF